MKALVMAGGGVDGAVCTALAVKKYGAGNVKTISFFYGQRHERELSFAKKLSDFYKVGNVKFDISRFFKGSRGTLLAGNGEIEKITYEAALEKAKHGILSEFVPYRGGVFFSIASVFAAACGFDIIIDPMNADSSHNGGFADTKPLFAESMQKSVYDGSARMVKVDVPFMTETKGNVVKLGAELGVPFNLTFGCYEGKERPCGECLNCRDRKRAFEQAGLKDVVEYEVV